jgi:3-deoxy-manno-octulosonate cytidylyltransferase (CMP-KDO synthetase)
MKFRDLTKTELEETEKLEQLRVLEQGYKIKTVITKHDTAGVDTPEDLKRVEALMKGK